MKWKLNNRFLYWGLIFTFSALYISIGTVSTLHAVTFFKLANNVALAILLAAGFELGLSATLFSILLTKNKDKFLPWLLMFILTGIQVIGNVFASFKHIATSGTSDWIYFQKSIIFSVQAINPEMYQVIISWLEGSILPLVNIGLVSLVVTQMKLMAGEDESSPIENLDNLDPDQVEEIIRNEVKKRLQKKSETQPTQPPEEEVTLIPKGLKNLFRKKTEVKPIIPDTQEEVNDDEYGYGPLSDEETKNLIDLQDEMSETKPIKDKIPLNLSQFKSPGMTGPEYVFPNNAELAEHLKKDLEEQLEFGPVDLTNEEPDKLEKKYPNILDELADPIKEPINKPRGWHFKKEFVDDDHNVFELGKFIINDPNKAPTSKK
jgi:hypothetical protein